MVSPGYNTKDWKVEVLTTSHNGDNDAELERVRESHPDEPECVVDRRVLGALAPTRCMYFFPSYHGARLTLPQLPPCPIFAFVHGSIMMCPV